jgi:hypothetical protein
MCVCERERKREREREQKREKLFDLFPLLLPNVFCTNSIKLFKQIANYPRLSWSVHRNECKYYLHMVPKEELKP